MQIDINGVKITLTEQQLKEIKEQTEKPSKEQIFLDLWNGCTIKFDFEKYPEKIFLMKNDKVIFEQDHKNGYLWCNYDLVWLIFKTEFGMEYDEIQSFIKTGVERHFKLGGLTPGIDFWGGAVLVERHFKLGGLTPYCSTNSNTVWWKDISNWGD